MPSDNHHKREAAARLAGLLEAEGLKDEALAVLKSAVRPERPARS